MKNRIFKIKIREESKDKFIIMGDSYKKFEDHFSDLIGSFTKRWCYDDSPEGKGNCLGRTINIEFLEIYSAKGKFVSFGGLKWASEETYDSEVEQHNINSKGMYCPYLRHLDFSPTSDILFLNDLLSSNRVISEPVFIRHITPCYDSAFYQIECLEKEDSYGFFKDENDVRPSSCTWVKKEEAERVGAVLYNKFIECIGEAAINESVVDRKMLLSLLTGAKNE